MAAYSGLASAVRTGRRHRTKAPIRPEPGGRPGRAPPPSGASVLRRRDPVAMKRGTRPMSASPRVDAGADRRSPGLRVAPSGRVGRGAPPAPSTRCASPRTVAISAPGARVGQTAGGGRDERRDDTEDAGADRGEPGDRPCDGQAVLGRRLAGADLLAPSVRSALPVAGRRRQPYRDRPRRPQQDHRRDRGDPRQARTEGSMRWSTTPGSRPRARTGRGSTRWRPTCAPGAMSST